MNKKINPKKNDKHQIKSNMSSKNIKYSLNKNIIINILNEYCKFKKKICINLSQLIKKRKLKNNVHKNVIKNKQTNTHKKVIKKHNLK